MGTRAAAFSAKIKSLRETQQKVSLGLVPTPTGSDLSTSYRWFSTTLLSILRDVPGLPYHMIRCPELDSERLSLYPILDYRELYETVYDFMSDLHLVTSSTYTCGKSLLTLLASLFPFMDRSTVSELLFNMTELVDLLPVSLCHETVDVLCDHILPFILGDSTAACQDYIPALLQTVLQKSPHDTAVHRKLLECVMTYKQEVHFDLLHVIAYGPTVAKVAAANLLFLYWPSLNPTPAERKDIADKFTADTSWISPICSNAQCGSSEPCEATKMCLDHSIPLTQRADLPPPAFYCAHCADKFALTLSKGDQPVFVDINLPIEQIELGCCNQSCRATDKIGVCICFSPECTVYNSHRPIRYCQQCYKIRHNSRRGANHVLQKPIQHPWLMSPGDKEVLQASVISLLSLARPFGSEQVEGSHRRTMSLLDDDEDNDEEFSPEDYLMASRYGIWLLVGLFKPAATDNAREVMGLLSMLFEWYKVTATLPNDKTGAKVEKIKSDQIPSWLKSLSSHSPQIFVQCLIPEPEAEAKVGGHWEISAPESALIKEVEHYPRENLHELSSIFCKIFDPDMSPLAFELDEMYRFVTERMQCGEPGGQQTVLSWLQTLCHLGVIIPLNILFHIFSLAIACLSPSSIDNEKGVEVTLAEEQDTMKSVQIFSCMVDVLIVQLKIQDVEPHVGMNGPFTLQTLSFTLDIFSSNWLQTVFHTKLSKCQNQTEIQENIFILCQLLRNLVRLMLNQDQADETDEENQNTLSTANTLINDDKKDHIKKQPGLGGFMAVLSNTFKTTVEKVPEDNSDSDSSLTVGPAELELIKEKSLDISDHPKHIQLMTKLFILISKLDDPEITFYVLDLLKSLALSEDCLYETSRKYKKLFTWLQHNHIIHNMWRILDSSHSQVALIAVPLLLSSLTLPHGSDILWKIIDEEFNSPEWQVRFAAVEKTTLIFRFLTDFPVKKSQELRSTLSHAFCHLISSMDDKMPQVSQRATIYLGTIHDKAIQNLLWCLECQFDLVPYDRPPILKNLYQLFNSLSDRNIITWDFFANRFESIINEIQETKSQKQEELDSNNHQQNANNGIRENGKENPRSRPRSGTESVRSIAQFLKHPYKRTYSAPAGIVLNCRTGGRTGEEDKNSEYRRQQSAPLLRQKVSRSDYKDYNVTNINRTASHSGTLSEDLALLSLELEDINKETIHLLVFLFMHFLSQPNQTLIPENKTSLAYLTVQRCFHGLYSLIGYDEVQQRFTTMPHKIRSTPQFCSFFSTLAQVMDNNFMIGNLHISNFVMILQRSPFPPRYAANWIPTYSIIQENLIYQGCAYTLWYLEPVLRRNWLEACLVLVYKYNFSEPESLREKVVGLMRIILNSLSAHAHVCSKLSKPDGGFVGGGGLTFRSHELSENSLGCVGTATLQGTEDNTAFNSRTSPTSNRKFDTEEENNSDKTPDINSDLETIFENARSENGDVQPNKHNHENPLFFDLLPQAIPEMQSGWVPDHQKITSEGLPDGWTMQLMDNGRVLFIDSKTGSHTWLDPRTGKECFSFRRKRGPFFSSPPSPLSLMDVLTMGGVGAESDSEREGGLQNILEEDIEQPAQERLLPIGGGQESRRNLVGKTHHHLSLLDRVWQVLGSEDQEDCLPLVGGELSSKIKIASSLDNIMETNNTNISSDTDKPERQPMENKVEGAGVGGGVGGGGGGGGGVGGGVGGDVRENSNSVRQRKFGVYRGERPDSESSASEGREGGGVGGGGGGGGGGDGGAQLPGVTQQSQLRIGEDTVVDRCSHCGAITETYSDSELSLALVVINTFVHRDPQLSAPLLPEIFLVASRIANKPLYSWEGEGQLTVIPGNPRSVARQFLRVCLQQLSSNGVFPLLFQIDLAEPQRKAFYSTIVSCLNDFTELYPTVPVQLFFENIDHAKQTMEQTLSVNLPNLICYLSFIQYDHILSWASVFGPLENFFRNLSMLTINKDGKTEKVEAKNKDLGLSNIDGVMKLVVFTMKMNGINNHRSMLEPISKVVGYAIQFCTFAFQDLMDICYYCNRAFVKDRDRSYIIRTVICKFMDALKYKTSIPDVNFLYLASMILQDAKGELPPNFILELKQDIGVSLYGPNYSGSTPWLEQYLPDIVEFVADVHTLSKVKSHVRGMTVGLNQDTLGGILKAALSQFLALEIARMSVEKSESKITKYMPWLFNPPNTISSQGPKEFLDCVSHIRLLSWLLLGAMSHTMITAARDGAPCQPIPLEASCHIADHIEVILVGFAEQSKTSVVHMCSLFHAFILSQLWTVYLEYINPSGNTKEEQLLPPSILLDFWVKVTPGILQLVSHSKVLAEMVNLHFLSLMEALLECRSTILAKLMPLWCPVLHAYNIALPDHIRVRLQYIHDSAPAKPGSGQDKAVNANLISWLQRLQFKMGQIELQASNATQFYTV